MFVKQYSVYLYVAKKTLIQLSFSSQYLCQVALGDQEGVLQVFSVKKNNDVSQVFKTLPGKEISRMELGGALGTVKDKIFTAAASEVRGHTKKGKLFLSFDTGMTEPIRSMSITGNDLLVAGAHVYSHFRDCRDAGRYLSEDVVSDVLALPGEKVPQLTPVLACGDRSLKVLRESSVAFGAELPGPPTALQLFYNDGGEKGDEVLYGTEDGKVKKKYGEHEHEKHSFYQVGLVQLTRQGPHAQWLLEREGVHSAIQCIDNFDVTGDGVRDLIIGRWFKERKDLRRRKAIIDLRLKA